MSAGCPQRYLRSAFSWVPWTYVHHPPTSFLLFHPDGVRAKAACAPRGLPAPLPPAGEVGRGLSFCREDLLRDEIFLGAESWGPLRQVLTFQENDRCVGIWNRLLQIHREQGWGQSSCQEKPNLRPGGDGSREFQLCLRSWAAPFSPPPLAFCVSKYSVLIRTNRGEVISMAKPLSAPSSPSGEAPTLTLQGTRSFPRSHAAPAEPGSGPRPADATACLFPSCCSFPKV